MAGLGAVPSIRAGIGGTVLGVPTRHTWFGGWGGVGIRPAAFELGDWWGRQPFLAR